MTEPQSPDADGVESPKGPVDPTGRQASAAPGAASWGTGIALGVAVGVAIGVAMGQIGVGIAMGAAIGIAISLAMRDGAWGGGRTKAGRGAGSADGDAVDRDASRPPTDPDAAGRDDEPQRG